MATLKEELLIIKNECEKELEEINERSFETEIREELCKVEASLRETYAKRKEDARTEKLLEIKAINNLLSREEVKEEHFSEEKAEEASPTAFIGG